jgi:hypothetical protein
MDARRCFWCVAIALVAVWMLWVAPQEAMMAFAALAVLLLFVSYLEVWEVRAWSHAALCTGVPTCCFDTSKAIRRGNKTDQLLGQLLTSFR